MTTRNVLSPKLVRQILNVDVGADRERRDACSRLLFDAFDDLQEDAAKRLADVRVEDGESALALGGVRPCPRQQPRRSAQRNGESAQRS